MRPETILELEARLPNLDEIDPIRPGPRNTYLGKD